VPSLRWTRSRAVLCAIATLVDAERASDNSLWPPWQLYAERRALNTNDKTGRQDAAGIATNVNSTSDTRALCVPILRTSKRPTAKQWCSAGKPTRGHGGPFRHSGTVNDGLTCSAATQISSRSYKVRPACDRSYVFSSPPSDTAGSYRGSHDGGGRHCPALWARPRVRHSRG
jgi:hypothetical protein